jgi:hypothetical protein
MGGIAAGRGSGLGAAVGGGGVDTVPAPGPALVTVGDPADCTTLGAGPADWLPPAPAPAGAARSCASPSRRTANTALQMLHRARTPASGTLPGSTR